MIELLAAFLMLVGSVFVLISAIGVARMPDLFMRLQATTKASTLGAGGILLSCLVHFGETDVGMTAVLVIFFLFSTAPISAHALSRAAYAAGYPLWEGTTVDDLEGFAGQARARLEAMAPDE